MTRKMKDSGIEWIGMIPEGWGLERLKYHAVLNPNIVLPSLSDDSDVTFIPMDHLKKGYHMKSTTTYEKVKKGYVIFENNDILMAKVTPCLENGNLAIASQLINGIGFGSTEINVIRCKCIENKYLYYLLQCDGYINKATYEMYGVAGLKRLDPSFIPNSLIPIPPQLDQQRIVSFLDAKCAEIDALIAAKEKSNALLKEYRQSIIFEAVTKGLDPNAPMKDSGIEWIGMIPEGWGLERLKYHAVLNPNIVLPSLSDDSDVTFIPMDHLKKGYHMKSTTTYEKVKKGYVIFENNDILMAKVTPCLENGNLAIASQLINGIGFGSTEINVIRCKCIENKYLYYLLQCDGYINKATYEMYGVAGLKRLDPSFIPNSLIPIPPQSDQQRIVSFLDAKCAEIDALIAANDKTISQLREYRQSVIFEAVTGKMEV